MTYYKWWNTKGKEVVEESKRIQLSTYNKYLKEMEKKGLKSEPFTISWTCRGEPSGNITAQFDMAKKVLNLSYTINKEEEFKYSVDIIKKSTHNGGFKYFFVCPNTHCQKPIRTLYKAPSKKYFLCRHCSWLLYDSQKSHNKTMDKYKRLYCGLYSPEEAYYIAMSKKLMARVGKI